jgi:hypothetical protein
MFCILPGRRPKKKEEVDSTTTPPTITEPTGTEATAEMAAETSPSTPFASMTIEVRNNNLYMFNIFEIIYVTN